MTSNENKGFSDEVLNRLKEPKPNFAGEPILTVTFSAEVLKALLARLDAAERVITNKQCRCLQRCDDCDELIGLWMKAAGK